MSKTEATPYEARSWPAVDEVARAAITRRPGIPAGRFTAAFGFAVSRRAAMRSGSTGRPLFPCNHLEPLRPQSKESTFPNRLGKEIQPVPFISSLYQFPCRIFPIHAGEDWLQL